MPAVRCGLWAPMPCPGWVDSSCMQIASEDRGRARTFLSPWTVQQLLQWETRSLVPGCRMTTVNLGCLGLAGVSTKSVCFRNCGSRALRLKIFSKQVASNVEPLPKQTSASPSWMSDLMSPSSHVSSCPGLQSSQLWAGETVQGDRWEVVQMVHGQVSRKTRNLWSQLGQSRVGPGQSYCQH